MLLGMTRTDIAASSGTRIYSDDDASLVPECESGRSVLDFDPARWVLEVVCVHPQERGRLARFEHMYSLNQLSMYVHRAQMGC